MSFGVHDTLTVLTFIKKKNLFFLKTRMCFNILFSLFEKCYLKIMNFNFVEKKKKKRNLPTVAPGRFGATLMSSNLWYPPKLIKATINLFITKIVMDNVQSDALANNVSTPKIVFSNPFINQNFSCGQLKETTTKSWIKFQCCFTTSFHDQESRQHHQNPRTKSEEN